MYILIYSVFNSGFKILDHTHNSCKGFYLCQYQYNTQVARYNNCSCVLINSQFLQSPCNVAEWEVWVERYDCWWPWLVMAPQIFILTDFIYFPTHLILTIDWTQRISCKFIDHSSIKKYYLMNSTKSDTFKRLLIFYFAF